MSNKANSNTCPKCGASIPADALQGLCPKCVLLRAATATETGLPPTATAKIPSLERVAAAFPQFEILELLGRGGMGFVFKARQPKLDRFVALKLLPDQLARDPHFAERFSREARMLARLNHPGIVSIFDFGQSGGFYYLLMEYVDGVNLRQAMQAGKFSPAAALGIVPKICEALQFAHEQGVLHRDIKPANILLDGKGRVKLADFGIAKLVGDEKPDLNLTATGATIGTPQYMAPEQLEQPGTVDHRADIYSLGVVFYEMLTGELPIGRFSPPSQRTPLDPRVDEVVMRTLEKEREKRYQSAGEVKTNVEHLTEAGADQPARTDSPPLLPDFVLCHPRLPRMAQGLTVYALVIAPALWLLGVATMDNLSPANAYAAFVEAVMRLVMFWGELIVTLLLFVGGWKLRLLKRPGLGLIRAGLWLNLVLVVTAILGSIWLLLLSPEPDVVKVDVGEAVLTVTQFAAVVFQVVALVWLRRHRAMLDKLLQTTTQSTGPRSTMVITPPTHSSWMPLGSRRGVLKWAVLALIVCGGAALLWRELRVPHQRSNVANALEPLPEGLVELVALTREPSDGVWWRADGTPANEGAFEKYGTSPQVGPGERAMLFIFRSRDSERQDSSRTYAFEGSRSWVSGGPPLLNGRKVSGGSFVAATFPESLRATTVRVGVAIDAWETVARDTGTASGSHKFVRHGQERKVGFFGAIENKAGDTILTLTHDLPEGDIRAVAVDDRGHEHANGTRHTDRERHAFTFANLSAERVREYRLEVRPYRWAEFKNVQLSPASSVPVRAPLGGGPLPRGLSSETSAPEVTLAVSAPPRETLVITGIVLSNGVPLPGGSLRAKLWPPSGLKPSPFVVQWKLAAANPDGAPWEIVVKDATSNTIAARLWHPHLPRLDWSVSPSAANLGKLSVTREARTFEVARALQTSAGSAVDWSVRIQLQSSPSSAPSSRGIKADFLLPANQVAVFELVTRSNGVIVPVPELAAYHINGTPETYTGKFILADDPDDLDSLTGLPRWTFGIIGPDERLTSQGLAVPNIPPHFNLSLELWKALQPDQEVVEGLSGSPSGSSSYGLRIRTQTIQSKPGLRHSSSGYGTNWMPAAVLHLESAATNVVPGIGFTFTAVELREVDGKRWLAIDYLDEVQGDCQKSFPWETKIPGFRAEVRTSEFAKDPSDTSAPRHQRVEYLLPDSVPRDAVEYLRRNVETALKQKTVRLGMGEQKLLFEFGSSSDAALKAWIKVIPPAKLPP